MNLQIIGSTQGVIKIEKGFKNSNRDTLMKVTFQLPAESVTLKEAYFAISFLRHDDIKYLSLSSQRRLGK